MLTAVHNCWGNRNGVSKLRIIYVYGQASKTFNVNNKLYWLQIIDKSKVEISVVERYCKCVVQADSDVAPNVSDL